MHSKHRSIIAIGAGLLFAAAIYYFTRPPAALALSEYLAWLADPRHGLTRERSVAGLNIRVKYLPPEYLAWREMKDEVYSERQRDSLTGYHRQSLTFLLSLAPERSQAETGSIVSANTNSYAAFADRVITLNFNMAEYLTLHTDAGAVAPALAGMENVYELNAGRDFIVVFAPQKAGQDLRASRAFDLEWNDMIFTTGIHHFTFQRTDIEALPKLNY